jgi:hypothetical protein
MNNRYMDGDAAAEMLERRWFAAFKAASRARAECEALIDELQMIEAAWNRSRERLAKLESLRDVLGEELAGMDWQPREIPLDPPVTHGVMSAA